MGKDCIQHVFLINSRIFSAKVAYAGNTTNSLVLHKIKTLRYIIYFCLLSHWACNNGTLYEETKTIPAPWKYADKVAFDYEVKDTTKAYDLLVNISHTDNFAYENIYMMITTIFPGGDSTRNPLSLQLAGPDGQWQGSCSGQTCELLIPVSSGAYFKKPGTYSLIFEQYSREEGLTGIEQLGLTISESRK